MTVSVGGKVYNGIKVRPDQEILSTVHDHAATDREAGVARQPCIGPDADGHDECNRDDKQGVHPVSLSGVG